MKILLVDDDPTVRLAVSIRLRSWGHESLPAADARTAVRRVDEDRPDVVVSDVVLPEGSGIDLLRRLKESDGGPPVILITAHGEMDRAVDAMREGAEDFLSKPLDMRKLKRALEAARERSRRDRGPAGASDADAAGPPPDASGEDDADRTNGEPHASRLPPVEGDADLPVGSKARAAEKFILLETLDRFDDDWREVARQLDSDVDTLRAKLSVYLRESVARGA